MSDTPRTDELLLCINEGRTYEQDGPMAKLARQLERELNKAWSPISTAPTDGTPFIAFGDDGISMSAKYTHGFGWVETHTLRHEITLWMPLPAAPLVADVIEPPMPNHGPHNGCGGYWVLTPPDNFDDYVVCNKCGETCPF